MISITLIFPLNESELQFDFIRSAGPGGQNVNKVSTACQLGQISTPRLPSSDWSKSPEPCYSDFSL